jgi:hypothetical protein
MMGLHKVKTAVMTGLLAGTALAAEPPKDTKRTQESLAADLQREMQCLSVVASQGQVSCALSHRGLVVEFAAPDTPKRSIWIHALGSAQSITNLGRRCMVVTLADPELQVEGQRAYVLLRDDAKVLSNSPASRKTCG